MKSSFLRWVVGVLVVAVLLAVVWFVSEQRAYRTIRETARDEVKGMFDSLGSRQFFKSVTAIAPYSPAVRQGDFLFVSGQIALVPGTQDLLQGSIEQESRQALENLGNVLRSAEYDYRDVVSAALFLKDLNDYEKVNAIYAAYFPEGVYPARTVLEVSRMPKNARIEINAIAYKSHR